MNKYFSRTRFRTARSLRIPGLRSILIVLGAIGPTVVLLLAQQRQVPARSGGTYRGAKVFDDGRQLYLDLGPCGGTIVTFHKPWNENKTGNINCQGRSVDLSTVTQK
jgi:hypothetical protein